jgi:hypothetical protein
MATSDVEIVRLAFDAFKRGDLVFRLRDGMVVQFRIYAERAQALESVGLAE